MKIKIPKKLNKTQINIYFKKVGLDYLINEKNFNSELLKPDLNDLYFLHNFIIVNKRINILEIGTGYSSLVISHAHKMLIEKYGKKIKNNIYLTANYTILDNSKKYINISKKRNKLINNPLQNFKFSQVQMTEFNGRYCTKFINFPKVNPEFIYLDGPSQYGVKNNNKFSFNIDSKDLMPMSSDILKIENFFSSGTIIISDGRRANINFLMNNFQRNWKIKNIEDRSILILVDEPLGKKNKKKTRVL
jgi:hypothetical protein